MPSDWIPGAGVGVLGSVVAWLLSWRIATARGEERLAAMQTDLRDLKDDFRAGMSEVRSFADATARLQSSQNVVNSVTAKSIETMCDKQDKLESTVADHTATLRLLTEVVMSKKENQQKDKL
jgi:hypothetical protein